MGRRTPPGPPGNLRVAWHLYGKGTLSYLQECAATYGDVVAMKTGPYLLYFLNDPDAIWDVLVTQSRAFRKPDLIKQIVGQVIGNGLILADGEAHRRQRKLLSPAFQPKAVQTYAPLLVSCTQAMIESWTPGRRYDIASELRALMVRVVGRIFFSADMAGRQKEVDATATLIQHMVDDSVRSAWLLPRWLPTPGNLRARRAMAEADAFILGLIRERRARSDPGGDLLGTLIGAADEEGGMSDRQLRDEIATLYAGGIETTSSALAWALYLIARHPEVEDKLLAELGPEPPTPDTALARIETLPYTEQVLSEVLRLYPSAWIFSRTATEDVEIDGYAVAKGTVVLFCPYVTHRNPALYAEPEAFRPERFAERSVASLPAGAYFPFGAGPRICIGRHLAWMEAKLLMASLLPKFRFRLDPGFVATPEPMVTLRPKGGMPMTVLPR